RPPGSPLSRDHPLVLSPSLLQRRPGLRDVRERGVVAEHQAPDREHPGHRQDRRPELRHGVGEEESGQSEHECQCSCLPGPLHVHPAGARGSQHEHRHRNHELTGEHDHADPEGQAAVDHERDAGTQQQDPVGGRIQDLAEVAALIEMSGDPPVDPVRRAQDTEEKRGRDLVVAPEQEPQEQRDTRQPRDRDEVRHRQDALACLTCTIRARGGGAHNRPAYAPPSTWIAVPVRNRACSEHTNAATVPKSSGRPITPAGMPLVSPPPSRCTRSVSCMPGWSELTVTPSAATSRATVLRKPVAPARAVLERIRYGIGCRTASDVIATTLPHRCSRIEGTAASHIAITERQLSSMAARYWSTLVEEKFPGGGPPAFVTKMSRPPRASRADSTKPRAPVAVETATVTATPPWPMVRAASPTAPSSRLQIATCTPSFASAAAAANPNPRLAAATAARRPEMPRSMWSSSWSSADVGPSGVDGPVGVAQRPGPTPGAQGDDLCADRDGGLLGRAGAEVEADRRHDPL